MESRKHETRAIKKVQKADTLFASEGVRSRQTTLHKLPKGADNCVHMLEGETDGYFTISIDFSFSSSCVSLTPG